MTFRCSGGCFFSFGAAPALLTLSVTDALFQSICSFSFADAAGQQSWLLSQSLRRDLKNYPGVDSCNKNILSFYLQEGWVHSNHGCSLWAFISNIWSPQHFVQHCRSLTYKVACIFWRNIQPLALLIYFPSDVLQEFKRCSMPGVVLIWATYFWPG